MPPEPSLTSKPVSPSVPEASAGSRNSARSPRTSSTMRGLDAARVDERIERREQLVAERAIAGRRAGAQPGLPLPGASERLVVALRRRQRVADRPVPPLGPQPQIDPEDHPVGGRLLDGRRHPARQLGVVVVQRQLARRPRGPAVGRIEVADVDVGREVQLLPAQLPHRHHHEAGGGAAVGAGRPDLAGQRGVAEADRHVEADVGERRQLARHLLGRPPAELARAEAQDLGAPHEPQPALEIGEDRARPPSPSGPRSAMTSAGLGRRR